MTKSLQENAGLFNHSLLKVLILHFSIKGRYVHEITCSVAVVVPLCYVTPVVLVLQAALTYAEHKTKKKNISTAFLFIILFIVGKNSYEIKLIWAMLN